MNITKVAANLGWTPERVQAAAAIAQDVQVSPVRKVQGKWQVAVSLPDGRELGVFRFDRYTQALECSQAVRAAASEAWDLNLQLEKE